MVANTAAKNVEKLIAELRKEHDAVISTMNKGLGHAKKCGDILLQLQEEGANGETPWKAWVKEATDLPYSTAALYCDVARNWAKIEAKDLTATSIRAALKAVKGAAAEGEGGEGEAKAQAKRKFSVKKDAFVEVARRYHVKALTLCKILNDMGYKVSDFDPLDLEAEDFNEEDALHEATGTDYQPSASVPAGNYGS